MDEQALNDKYPGRMVYREGDRIIGEQRRYATKRTDKCFTRRAGHDQTNKTLLHHGYQIACQTGNVRRPPQGQHKHPLLPRLLQRVRHGRRAGALKGQEDGLGRTVRLTVEREAGVGTDLGQGAHHPRHTLFGRLEKLGGEVCGRR